MNSMHLITDLIQEAKKELEAVRTAVNQRKINCEEISEPDFRELLIIECEIQMSQRGIFNPFVIDNDNDECIHKLWQYLTAGNGFKGSPNKGMFIMGGIGTGKTILIKGLAGVISKLTARSFLMHSAFDLNRMILNNGIEPYAKKPLLIDDLGKEQPIVKDYGTDTRPLMELFSARYDNGAITFATSNYKIKTLVEKYGEQTIERFMEMFNFIELIGKSRRV